MYIHKKLKSKGINYYEGFSKEPSLTVPNEALSIEEIFLRYAQGNLPQISKQFYYDEESINAIDEDNIQDGEAYDLSFRDDLQDLTTALHERRISDDKKKEKARNEKSLKDDGLKDDPVDDPVIEED